VSKTPVLTPTQKKFCDAYVDLGCTKGGKAARPYSKDPYHYASETLAKKYIQDYIEERKKEKAAEIKETLVPLGITPHALVLEVGAIFRDVANVPVEIRLKAATQLGRWFGMENHPTPSPTRNSVAGDDIFAGKTVEELEYFAKYGRFPVDAPQLN
jgi:hypothetical protein